MLSHFSFFPVYSTHRLNIFIFSSNKGGCLCKTVTSLRLHINKISKWWDYFRFASGFDLRKLFSTTESFSALVLLDYFGSNFTSAFTFKTRSVVHSFSRCSTWYLFYKPQYNKLLILVLFTQIIPPNQEFSSA